MAVSFSAAKIAAGMAVAAALISPLAAQESGKPPVRVNILNVCTPPEAERAQIATALASLPQSPRFGQEFEVARGRSVLPEAGRADWVRLRREFPPDSTFISAQYSFSAESGAVTETLVIRLREPRDLVLVSIEDTVTAAKPDAVLASDTPAGRIRLERLGKGNVVLARCPQVSQTAYEPLFRQASSVMAAYRAALQTRTIVAAELSRLSLYGNPPPSRPTR